MTYADMAALATDPAFVARVNACGVEQAQLILGGAEPQDPGSVAFAETVTQTGNTLALTSNVAARPGITADSPDADILAAVQYAWPLMGAAYTS